MKKDRSSKVYLAAKSNKKRTIVKRTEDGFVVLNADGSVGLSSSIRRARLAAKGMSLYNQNIMRHAYNARREVMCAISINNVKQSMLESKYKDIEVEVSA